MNKFVSILISSILLSQSAFATCDFSSDIKAMPDGSYSYTRECHIEVGKAVKKVKLLEEEIVLLNKALELKDLALVKQKERADLWMDSAFKMNDKLQAYDSAARTSTWLYFGLGVAATVLSVWAAGQLR